MQLLTLNAAGKPLAPPAELDPKRRRLSQVIGRHVDRRRPHMIAVQRARDPLQPIEEAWIVRGRDRKGQVKPWPRLYLPADAIVVVVYLPRGGGGGAASGSRGKGGMGIVLSIAAVALIAFAGPLGGLAAGALSLGATATAFAASAISAGIAVGGAALLSIASRSKANKQVTDTTQVYGVAGGGNLPKPGDRIPRGYGRSWMKPDLSQPDFSQYDGDDQILFKRHTLGVGKYRPYQIRAGKQVVWQESAGFVEPFNDARNAVEFVYGTASTLIPSDVVSATGIGGALPRPSDFPAIAGPFLINQRGALVSRLQVDFQFPQGISATITKGSGATLSNQPGAWGVTFEYAPIDDSGHVTGDWQTLYSGTSATEGLRFATHPLRYTKFKDVPPGRYAVRGRNLAGDTSSNTGTGVANIDAAQWDGASGWVADTAIRDNVTEMALRLYATKATQAAAFSEIEIDAAAIIPVWSGSAWVEQETSKAVWAFVDILRDQDYGGGLPDDQIDVGTALGYASSLTEYDTFDGSIRGPVSVYEAAASVLLTMRGEPVHTGRYWSLVRDEPKSVRRHLITRRQILKGSTQISFDLDTASGAGHVIGEFDQDGDYRNPNQCTAIYGEASLTPTRQRWTGVTSFAHAQHLTRWRAACGAYRRQSAPFSVEMEGRIYRRGDSIGVDQWFIDTRKAAGVITATGNRLTLDADVAVAAGDAVVLRDRTGREWGPLALAGQGTSAREIVLDAASRATLEDATGLDLDDVLSDGRQDMTTVLVGPLATLRENYLIRSVRPDGSSRAQVEALIDDGRVWSAIGATPTVPPDGFAGLSDPESPRILNVTAATVQMPAGLRLDYAIQPGRGGQRFEVGFSYDGGTHYVTLYEGTATIGQAMLNPVDPSVGRVRARAFGATGLPGPYFYVALPLGPSTIVGSLLENLSVEIEKLSAQTQKEIADINKLGQGALALGRDQTALALSLANDTLRGADRQLAEALNLLGGLQATQATNDYTQRETIKIGTSANFAALERETKVRLEADSALSSITTTLGVQLTLAQGDIVANATAIQGLSTFVTNIDGRVTSQSQHITTLGSRIDANDLAISGQATATQQLTTRVTLTEGNISSLSQSLTALQSTVSTQGGQISGQATAISSLETRTSTVEGVTTAQGSAITALQSTVSAQGGQISGTATALDQVTTRVTQAESTITAEGQRISSLESTVQGQGGAIQATAQYTEQVNSRVANAEGVINAQADYLRALTTTVGDHTATLTTYGASIDGVKVQFGVTGTIDGQTGGFVFTGVKKLDGSASYSLNISGDVFVDGSIYGRKLASYTITTAQLTTDQLIVNGHIFDNAISTVKGAEADGPNVSYTYTNSRGQTTRLAIFGFYSGSGGNTVPNATAAASLNILINGNIYKSVPASAYPFSGNFYLLSQAICRQIDLGPGTFTIQVLQSNQYGYGKCDILLMEISK